MINILAKYTSRFRYEHTDRYYTKNIASKKIHLGFDWFWICLIDYPSTKCIFMDMFHATKKNVDPYYIKFLLDMVYFLLDNMTDFRQESV